MSIVDMHCLYCNVRNERYTEVDVLEFSDLICKKLMLRPKRQNELLGRTTVDNHSILERISNKNGNMRFILTDMQESRGRNVGRSIHHNCFVCQKYLTPTGETEYVQTTFRCSECKMPLCKKD
jgi:hypothetical protein